MAVNASHKVHNRDNCGKMVEEVFEYTQGEWCTRIQKIKKINIYRDKNGRMKWKKRWKFLYICVNKYIYIYMYTKKPRGVEEHQEWEVSYHR